MIGAGTDVLGFTPSAILLPEDTPAFALIVVAYGRSIASRLIFAVFFALTVVGVRVEGLIADAYAAAHVAVAAAIATASAATRPYEPGDAVISVEKLPDQSLKSVSRFGMYGANEGIETPFEP